MNTNAILVFVWGVATALHIINPPETPPLPIWVYTGLLCLMNVTAAMDANLKRSYRRALGIEQ
jgi:hypothetical protein